MKSFLRYSVRIFATFGLLVFISIVMAAVWAQSFVHQRPTPPKNIILHTTIDGRMTDVSADVPMRTLLLGPEPSLYHLINTLHRAAEDTRVKGLVVRIGSPDLGLAQVQELRDAVQQFRKGGKFAFAFSESFGEFSPGHKPYYLATAFDQIWLQPVGMVGLTELSLDMPFARDALDKLGIQPQIGQRAEYKSAFSPLVDRALTPANREQYEALLADITRQYQKGIAAGRNQKEDDIKNMMKKGPLLDTEARANALVDHLEYYDALQDVALEKAGVEAGFMAIEDYDAAFPVRPPRNAPAIALIPVSGLITRGESAVNPLNGAAISGAMTLAEGIEAAAKDASIRALVVRIDSGGGSPAASETIRRALVKARESGKPVVISMGNTAASGGYWVAMSSTFLLAQPGTVTGSIGVLAGKLSTQELWDKLHVNWDTVNEEGTTLWSSIRPYGPVEEERLNAMLDRTYGQFVDIVAKERKMPLERVKAIAKGRVWTGSQAKDLGLVDDLGGLRMALDKAKSLAGLPLDQPARLIVYPRPADFLSQLFQGMENLGAMAGFAQKIGAWAAVAAERLGVSHLMVTTGDAWTAAAVPSF